MGLFQVHRGPANDIAQKNRVPEDDRTGHRFHPRRLPLASPAAHALRRATRQPGSWERAYVHFVGGGLLVVGDRLFIYYSGLSGEAPNGLDMYAGGATGVAFLRRDGFASLEADAGGGTLTTRKCASREAPFRNADARAGEIAGVLDAAARSSRPLPATTAWRSPRTPPAPPCAGAGADDLGAVAGKEIRLRFHLRSGSLYSFWVSPHADRPQPWLRRGRRSGISAARWIRQTDSEPEQCSPAEPAMRLLVLAGAPVAAAPGPARTQRRSKFEASVTGRRKSPP